MRLLGAVAAVAAAALFARLTERPDRGGSAPFPAERPDRGGSAASPAERPGGGGSAASPAALWFAAGIGVSLGSGRIAFTLGVALGLGALLAAGRGRSPVAVALALATGLASPLSGGFLALAALAGAPDPGRRRAPARRRLGAAAILPVGVLAVAFPTPGYEPFAPSSFWPALALIVILGAAAPALRTGAALYAVACLAAYAVPTPVGGNAVRLGALFAGPLAAGALGGERRRILVLLALPLAYWQLQAPVRDVVVAHGDPATAAAYYAPLERLLTRLPGGPHRVEVPPTRNHWEAALLAPRVALARGWERQLDIADDGLFYRPRLTAAAYAAWLRATGVAYVALPDAPLDYAAGPEAALIRAGPAYLRPVARLAHWRLYAVAGAQPLASAPARLVELGADRFVLRFARAGTSVVRLRFTDYWVAGPRGCVRPAAGGFTAVTAPAAGRLTVSARLSLGSLARRLAPCPGPAGAG